NVLPNTLKFKLKPLPTPDKGPYGPDETFDNILLLSFSIACTTFESSLLIPSTIFFPILLLSTSITTSFNVRSFHSSPPPLRFSQTSPFNFQVVPSSSVCLYPCANSPSGGSALIPVGSIRLIGLL